MSSWFRFVNKVGIIIGAGLIKYYGVKVIQERFPGVVTSYHILKWICKARAMRKFVPYWILLPHCFRVGSPIIPTATYLTIPNEIIKGYFWVLKYY